MWIEERMNVTHAKSTKRIRLWIPFGVEGGCATRLEWPILYPKAVIRIKFSALPGNSIGNAIRMTKVIFGRVKRDSTANNLSAIIFARLFPPRAFLSLILPLYNFIRNTFCYLIFTTVSTSVLTAIWSTALWEVTSGRSVRSEYLRLI